MKKVFMIIAMAITAQFVTAQEKETSSESKSPIRFGVNASLHVSAIDKFYDNSKGKFGPSFGVFAQIPVKQNWYFVPQLEYTMDGDYAKPAIGDQKISMSYISVPLMAKYYFALSKDNADKDFYLTFGPQFGFMVSNKFTGNIVTAEELIAQANIKKFNFGVALGGGYKLDNNWELFGRFDYGFTKVYSNVSANTINYKLGVGVNYIFGN